ncbi:MAG: zinc-ribbon domain-containing protein [Bacteroidetes bacterium]|nr:zinc-ribbon domain-containing protein [Bacteroidota bacterium]
MKKGVGNLFTVKFPHLIKEWHPTKNNNIDKATITYGSNKKAWWICKKKHIWIAEVSKRTIGRGCPYCSNKKVNKENSLAYKNPKLAIEWNYKRNGKLTPNKTVPGSGKIVWWKCKYRHEWQRDVYSRNKGVGCPYCSNKKVSSRNSLSITHPALAKEWNFKKNNLKPDQVVVGSSKKVWWICKFGHEWDAIIQARKKGSNCPFCRSQVSRIELMIFAELKYLFNDAVNRYKIEKVESDIYIPSLKISVEYDGVYWHKNRFKIDNSKSKFFISKNILPIRIREKGLKKITRFDVLNKNLFINIGLIHNILKKIISNRQLTLKLKTKIGNYINQNKFLNEKYYHHLIAKLPLREGQKSLNLLFPKLAREWDKNKNGVLKPENYTAFSNRSVWWKCKKGHSWKTAIHHRTLEGTGCAICSGRKPSSKHNFQFKFPEIVKQWHPTKNGVLKPENFTPFSHSKIWWLCNKNHEWETQISKRASGSGCPFCSGQKLTIENSLAKKNPSVANEWNYNRNGKIKPHQVSQFSKKIVWWKCKNKHEWKAKIVNRNKRFNSVCPFCSNRKVCSDNNLKFLFPAISKDWNYRKNRKLKPENILAVSAKKVWWVCKNGHTWDTTVRNRTLLKTTCPFCLNMRVNKENSLAFKNPRIAKEWNYKRNGNLKPTEVVFGSGKIVWWKCKFGHEWERDVYSRNKGVGCLICYNLKRKKVFG